MLELVLPPALPGLCIGGLLWHSSERMLLQVCATIRSLFYYTYIFWIQLSYHLRFCFPALPVDQGALQQTDGSKLLKAVDT